MENRYTSDFYFQSQLQASLTGALNEAEQAALNLQLTNDLAAQEEYVFSKNLTVALSNQELFAVSTLMHQIISTEGLLYPEDYPGDKASPQQSSQKYPNERSFYAQYKTWIWGMVVVLLIATGAYGLSEMQKANRQAKNTQLMQQYLQPLEDNFYTQTPLSGLDDLKEGMRAYNDKDYRKAAQLLGKHYRFTKDENIGLYYAVAMLMIDEPVSEVEKVLSQILPKLSEPLRYEAEWYFALTLLKAGKLDQLIGFLPNIASQNPHKKAAIALLNDLKE
jgi:hypothetical protein